MSYNKYLKQDLHLLSFLLDDSFRDSLNCFKLWKSITVQLIRYVYGMSLFCLDSEFMLTYYYSIIYLY